MNDSNKAPNLFAFDTQNQSLFGGLNSNTNLQQNNNSGLFNQSQSLFGKSNNQGIASPFASFSNTNNNGGLFGNKEEKPSGNDSTASPFGSLNNNSAFFGKDNNEKPLFTTNNPFTSTPLVNNTNFLFSNNNPLSNNEKPSLTTNNPFTSTPLVNNTNSLFSINNNPMSNNENSLSKSDNPFTSLKINDSNSLFGNNNQTSLFNNTNKKSDMFTNNNENKKEEKKSLFDNTDDNKSLFNSNINSNPSSLFTHQETNQAQQKSNFFGNISNDNSIFSKKTDDNKTLFNKNNENNENKTNQSSLFGPPSTNNNDNSSLLNQNNPFNKPNQQKGLSLFGDISQPKDEPKSSPLSAITNHQEKKSNSLFSPPNEIGNNQKLEKPQKKVDNPFTSSNLFNANTIVTEEKKSNSFLNNSENNKQNIFQQSPSTPIETVNEESKDEQVINDNDQNEIVSPVKSPFSNLNSNTTFIQKSSSSTSSVPLNFGTTPGGLFSLHNNNSTFFIPPDALKSIKEANKESSFSLLFTEYTNTFNTAEKIKPISNEYNAIFSEIEKIITNITNTYTSTLTDQNDTLYQDLITATTSEEIKKSSDNMKGYYELLSNLSFSTIHETISNKYKEFLKEWEKATVNNKDNLKQINYKGNNVYIGEYEISDNDDHSQKIIIKNKGIVRYNNGNILIQEIINESEKKGIMFNDNEIYIGRFKTEKESTVFEGIMINEKNIIFLGTFNLLEEEDAHNGLIIAYEQEAKNLKINSSKKLKLIINKENNQMKCEFLKDNITYHIGIGKYVFKISETESLCLFYQSKENSPIYLGVIEYNKEKKSYYPKNNETNMLIYSNNDVYQGSLLANTFYIKNGKGKCLLNSKQLVIEGEFENNIIKETIKIYPKGKEDVFFKGTHNKMKPTEGEIHYYNKDFYQGQFNDEFQLSGKGKYIYNNNIVYEGEWKNNNKHGKGTIIKDNNGDKYEVEYENDNLIEFFE